MSATKKVTCEACKGRGQHEVYVSEWAEMFERIGLWWKRVSRRFRKPVPVKPTGTTSILSDTSAGIQPNFDGRSGCNGCAFLTQPDDHPNCVQCFTNPSPDFPGWIPRKADECIFPGCWYPNERAHSHPGGLADYLQFDEESP